MIVGWPEMGARERLCIVARAKSTGIERVEAMDRALYDSSADTISFATRPWKKPDSWIRDERSMPWTKCFAVDESQLARALSMTRDELRNWVTFDYLEPQLDEAVKQIALHVPPEEVARTVAEADALWEALDEC